MTGKFSQPVVFNIITVVAMLFSLLQLVAVAQIGAVPQAVYMIEDLVEEGEIEDETLSARLDDEATQIGLSNVYMLVMLLIAIFANVAANYYGRGRHFENTARIREMEAEIRGLRGS